MSPRFPDANKPVIVLLGNYAPDRQESMLRFRDLLREKLEAAGYDLVLVAPSGVLGRSGPRGSWGKWFGYIDKYVLFPLVFSRQLYRAKQRWPERKIVVHICDHSNSVYAHQAGKGGPVLITCHDLLAVRGARGEDVACPASSMGKLLQAAIFRGLSDATAIACVSQTTHSDLLRLGGENLAERSRVVPLALNYAYRPMTREEAVVALARAGIDLPYRGFVLHVGSGEPRKNRQALPLSIETIAPEWNGPIVFAGENWREGERRLARQHGVESRVRAVIHPSNETLCALYNCAHALVFMSRAEGFGWPILEAQAAGCPVICSDRTSAPEVAGEGALICGPDDYAGVGQRILRLRDEAVRGKMIALGFENAARYPIERMMVAYEEIYRTI